MLYKVQWREVFLNEKAMTTCTQESLKSWHVMLVFNKAYGLGKCHQELVGVTVGELATHCLSLLGRIIEEPM